MSKFEILTQSRYYVIFMKCKDRENAYEFLTDRKRFERGLINATLFSDLCDAIDEVHIIRSTIGENLNYKIGFVEAKMQEAEINSKVSVLKY